jgi:hypothetical protein
MDGGPSREDFFGNAPVPPTGFRWREELRMEPNIPAAVAFRQPLIQAITWMRLCLFSKKDN